MASNRFQVSNAEHRKLPLGVHRIVVGQFIPVRERRLVIPVPHVATDVGQPRLCVVQPVDGR